MIKSKLKNYMNGNSNNKLRNASKKLNHTKKKNINTIIRSRKYHKQKGGDNPSITIEQIRDFCTEKQLPNVLKLMEELSFKVTSKNPFTYQYMVPFAFANTILKTPKSYLDWYKEKNPTFGPIQDTLTVTEYEPLVVEMCKDLLILYFTLTLIGYDQEGLNKTVENNNASRKSIKLGEEKRAQILKIIQNIDRLIREGYLYVFFIKECMTPYILLFSNKSIKPMESLQEELIRYKTEKSDNETNGLLYYIAGLLDSPFIILPTFYQINYIKVINSVSAPVLNFRMTNTKVSVHNSIDFPIYEILHDLTFHADIMHDIQSTIEKILNLGKNNVDYTLVKDEYNNRCGVISSLFEYYNYKASSLINEDFVIDSNIERFSEKEKYLFACLLFYVFHEDDSVESSIFEFFKIRFISYLKDKLENNSFFLEYIKPLFVYKGEPKFIINLKITQFSSFIEKIRVFLDELQARLESNKKYKTKYKIETKFTHNPKLFD
jgi:hypothetical protein